LAQLRQLNPAPEERLGLFAVSIGEAAWLVPVLMSGASGSLLLLLAALAGAIFGWLMSLGYGPVCPTFLLRADQQDLCAQDRFSTTRSCSGILRVTTAAGRWTSHLRDCREVW